LYTITIKIIFNCKYLSKAMLLYTYSKWKCRTFLLWNSDKLKKKVTSLLSRVNKNIYLTKLRRLFTESLQFNVVLISILWWCDRDLVSLDQLSFEYCFLIFQSRGYMYMCNQGLHGRVVIHILSQRLNWYLIDILIDTLSTLDWHLINSLSIVGGISTNW